MVNSEDLDLFVGRSEQIDILKDWSSEQSFTRSLLTGSAGVGKTSLVCKAYYGLEEFIRLDLSILPNISLIFSFIARRLIERAVETKCPSVKKLKNEYEKVIQTTTGRRLTAGKGPVPAGIESVYSTTHIPFIPQDHVNILIEKALKILHKKLGRITLLLDEADPNLLPGATRDNMLGIIRSLKIKKPSLLIWPVRDEGSKYFWENPSSMERQLFMWHLYVPPLDAKDSPGAPDVLYKRLEKVSSKNRSKEIILKDLAQKIAILADGNIREYIRFCKEVLKTASKNSEQLPISNNFAISQILSFHKELVLSEEEYNFLKYLASYPSSSSDDEIKTEFDLGETQIRARLKDLEKKYLAVKKIGKHGKLIYKPSEKAKILINIPR